MSDITRILQSLHDGDPAAADRLVETLHHELRDLAAGQLARESPGHTLQPTALVNEAYLRLLGGQSPTWENRAHFFGAAAEAMRRILVDRARRRDSLKRGGDRRRVDLPDNAAAPTSADSGDLEAIDLALTRLAAQHPDKAELVKLRYFAGLTLEQAAETLNISRATAARHWAFARAWLYDAITGNENPPKK